MMTNLNLISRDKNYLTAFMTTLLASMTHIGTAVVIAFLVKYIFIGIGHFARMNMTIYVSKASGVLIVCLGLLLLLGTLFNRFNLQLK